MYAIVGIDRSTLIWIERCRSVAKEIHAEDRVAAIGKCARAQPPLNGVFLCETAVAHGSASINPRSRKQRGIEAASRQGVGDGQRVDVDSATQQVNFRRVGNS